MLLHIMCSVNCVQRQISKNLHSLRAQEHTFTDTIAVIVIIIIITIIIIIIIIIHVR